MNLARRLNQEAYEGYAYAYPHKTSYRDFNPPLSMADAWRGEDRDQLFLYVHLPFCEFRCGFCNLLTTVNPRQGLVGDYLAALERQSRQVVRAVEPGGVSRLAFGGGTPSFLPVN